MRGGTEMKNKVNFIGYKPSKEEVILVNKAFAREEKKIKSGKTKLYTEEEFYKMHPEMFKFKKKINH